MDMLEINTDAWRWLTIHKHESYGGKSYNISFSDDLTNLLDWVIAHKKQLELEDKARLAHESVRSAYEQYITTLKLVTSGH
jgi:hypothetical protein